MISISRFPKRTTLILLCSFILLLLLSANGLAQEPESAAEAKSRIVQAQANAERAEQVFFALFGSQKIDGATAILILLIGSYVVDRVSAGLLWLLTHFKVCPDPRELRESGLSDVEGEVIVVDQIRNAETLQMLLYYLFALITASVLLSWFCHLELLGALGFDDHLNPATDRAITGLIMVIGAERVAQWLQLEGTPGSKSQMQPVMMTGNLVLKNPPANVTPE